MPKATRATAVMLTSCVEAAYHWKTVDQLGHTLSLLPNIKRVSRRRRRLARLMVGATLRPDCPDQLSLLTRGRYQACRTGVVQARDSGVCLLPAGLSSMCSRQRCRHTSVPNRGRSGRICGEFFDDRQSCFVCVEVAACQGSRTSCNSSRKHHAANGTPLDFGFARLD